MSKSLGQFVRFFRSQRHQYGQVVSRIARIYDRVWPCSFQDEDLGLFLNLLYLSVRYFKPRTVVQTGTFVGTSSIAMGLAMKENRGGELFTIDPEPSEYFGVCEPVSIARRATQAAGLDSHIHFIRGYSTLPFDCGRMSLPREPHWRLLCLPSATAWSMLVVDGDHTYLGCYSDLEHGSPKLAEADTGLVVVHDYRGISEVRRAVKDWTTQHGASRMAVVPSPCGIALIQP